MSTPASPGPLLGLAAAVSQDAIGGLLLQRGPDDLFTGAAAGLLTEIKRGVGAEVEQITGGVPSEAGIRDLALWAVALGVAANVESSLFPEQQLGDGSRAALLQTRYLGVRAQLAQAIADSGTGAPGSVSVASFDGFEQPSPWPLPAAGPYGRWVDLYSGAERGWLL